MTFREWVGLDKPFKYENAKWLGPICAVVVGIALIASIGTLSIRAFELAFEAEAEMRAVVYLLVAIIGFPLLIWRSVVAQKSANIAEQGNITTQFTKAVEQLGAEKTVKRRVWEPEYVSDTAEGNRTVRVDEHGREIGLWVFKEETVPNLEVRLGAIYLLEKIARDHLEMHISVMELLCAYVRENAALNSQYAEDFKERSPRVDIQSVLTVIGRRNATQLAHENSLRLIGKEIYFDFSMSHLVKLKMSKGNFNFSNFEGARLNNSMIMGAKIENCWFFQSDLQNSFLEDAYCKQSLFSLANLENCYLGGAEMLTYPCLDKQQLSDAIGSDDTLLPEASERPPKWPTHKEQAREVWMKRTAATGLPTSK